MSQQGSSPVRKEVVAGIFVVIAACVTGVFLLASTLLEKGFVVIGPGVQVGNPNAEPTSALDVPFIPTSMCPGIIPRSLVEGWSKVGETTIDTTRIYIDEFDRMRTGGEFEPQDVLSPGVLIITDFGNGESFIYQSQPVRPIVHYRSWGVFETTGEYVAIQSGSCMSIKP